MLEGIFTHVTTSDDVLDIIGKDPPKLFFDDVPAVLPNAASQEVKIKAPYLLIEMVNGDSIRDLAGDTGTAEVYLQVNAYGKSATQARTLYWKVRARLNDAQHAMWGDLSVQHSMMQLVPSKVSIPPTDGKNSSDHIYAGRLEMLVNWDESNVC